MADGLQHLTGRVQAVEEKLDGLSATVTQLSATVTQLSATVTQLSATVSELSVSVDQRFASVDQRFDAVDAAFVEQRAYTEFCYSRLEAKMNAGFGRLERKLDQFIDAQLQTNQLVDRRLRALEHSGGAPDAQA